MQISIVIPVFNAAKYVEQAVTSALQQPETAEIILIEDGSTDRSWQICTQLAQEHEKVVAFQFPDKGNHGPAAARNLGIDYAKYEFIAFLDADDFYLPDRFTYTHRIFQAKPTLQVAYAPVGFYYQNQAAEQLHQRHSEGLETIDFLLENQDKFFEKYILGEKGYISFDAITIRKKVFEQLDKFDIALRHAEDTDLILRFALAKCIQRTQDQKPVTLARIHPERSVYNLPKMYNGRKQFFLKWLKLSTQNHWSKAVNRHLLRRTLEMDYLASHGTTRYANQPLFRLGFKVVRLIKYLLQMPSLLLKVF